MVIPEITIGCQVGGGVDWALKRLWVITLEIELRVSLPQSTLAKKKIKPS
jgi:O-acetyl-ADP-ribose deacetylase (regulator of RNase III)